MSPQVVWLFIFAILSGTLMGTAQKFLAGYSPWLVNGIAALVTAFFALLIWFFTADRDVSWPLIINFHRSMILLGLAYLFLNIPYSILYSQSIAVAYVPIIVTGGMTILLGLVGYFFFHEPISWRFIVGALMVLGGMGIIVMK